MKFSDLKLAAPLQNALKEIGYETPTPIQKQAIPIVLEGHDLLGIAQTGTGKTAAFCLPLLNRLFNKQAKNLARSPKALILTPTRELAIQIHQNLEEYGKNLNQRYSVIFGGVSQNKQVRDLQKGPHILVATPGRLLDLINQKHLYLDKVETFVLDEADRMLDMGFMRDIEKVLKLLPKKRHNLFFSATMPKEIQTLAETILVKPKKVEVTPESTTVKLIQQSAMFVEKAKKVDLLIELLKDKKNMKTLVFVQMKHVANRITEKLMKNGIKAAAIHGNKSQGARQRAIQDFANDDIQVLVATDIASRGIDINGITHVINYELSNILESYVHRIGRTARAGKDGIAISLVTGDEKSYLAAIENVTKQKIKIDRNHSFHSQEAEDALVTSVGKAKLRIEGPKGAGRGRGRSGKPGRKKSNNKSSNTRNKNPSRASGSRERNRT